MTYLVGADIDESISICARLVDGGMRPVAHVPARAFVTMGDAEDYLSRLRGVGVEDVLVLGGGAPQPAGELHETMQILESGLLQRYEFKTVGVAAHPEGHPDIPEDELLDALLRKAAWARDHGVDLYFETQFCFEPEPIVEWEKRTRAALTSHLKGTDSNVKVADGTRPAAHSDGWLPSVRLGVAGPAKISSLIKFGTMSGVGNSLNFVSKYAGNVFKLATKMGPDELILGVAEHRREDPECMIEGFIHPSGGSRRRSSGSTSSRCARTPRGPNHAPTALPVQDRWYPVVHKSTICPVKLGEARTTMTTVLLCTIYCSSTTPQVTVFIL